MQWLISNFLHIDLDPRFANIIFLGAFGIVDAKLGWEKLLGWARAKIKPEQGTKKAPTDQGLKEDPSLKATRRLQEHIKLGEFEAAMAIYKKLTKGAVGWHPPEKEWLQLVQGAVNLSNWDDSIEIMQEYLKHSEKPDSQVRLKLAQILIKHRERPAKALEVLAEIPPNTLSAKLESTRAELARRAEMMVQDGVMEIDDDAPR